MASSYIPFTTGHKAMRVQGRRFYDGGFSDNLPTFETGRTITVSPFSGSEDICPLDEHSSAPTMYAANMSLQVLHDLQIHTILFYGS